VLERDKLPHGLSFQPDQVRFATSLADLIGSARDYLADATTSHASGAGVHAASYARGIRRWVCNKGFLFLETVGRWVLRGSDMPRGPGPRIARPVASSYSEDTVGVGWSACLVI
jgi:hypothetical protein